MRNDTLITVQDFAKTREIKMSQFKEIWNRGGFYSDSNFANGDSMGEYKSYKKGGMIRKMNDGARIKPITPPSVPSYELNPELTRTTPLAYLPSKTNEYQGSGVRKIGMNTLTALDEAGIIGNDTQQTGNSIDTADIINLGVGTLNQANINSMESPATPVLGSTVTAPLS